LSSRKVVAGLVTLVVAAAGVAGLALVFNARDDATLSASDGPGVARDPGARPAVAPGNVVLLFSDERLTLELREFALHAGGEATPELIAAGQAMIVQRRPGLRAPVVAVTSDRRLDAQGPEDPELQAFVDYWLGRRG